MDRAFQGLLLVRGELEAERLARVCDRMMDPQALQPGFGRGVEGVVGGTHVRVLRVGRDRGDDLGRKHRVPPRRIYGLGNRLWHTDASFQDPPGRLPSPYM